MSDVQLSSSALERTAARRTFPLHARTGACRSLFGPVDHDELAREMKSKLREISERDRRRWNFDFDTDTPLRGQFEWEEASVDAVPVFYRDSVQRGKARIPVAALPRGSRDCSGREAGALSRVSSPEATGARSAELNRENRAEQLNSGKPQRRALVCIPRKRASTGDLSSSRISDYFGKKKRTSETKQGTSPVPVPLEQTPRKRIR
ncbi:cyclin dependent kinase inhibitor 1Ca [Scleropages formosus]|uniref:Cyclin-dependent kinase inhibitor 1C n=1 Tax=Scleropages formosus TaxID=113540 RepID=A0A8C9W060_SCLFO|nr:cyclin-dependent kinase inhibitor 1C-like [Scleropages formosus]